MIDRNEVQKKKVDWEKSKEQSFFFAGTVQRRPQTIVSFQGQREWGKTTRKVVSGGCMKLFFLRLGPRKTDHMQRLRSKQSITIRNTCAHLYSQSGKRFICGFHIYNQGTSSRLPLNMHGRKDFAFYIYNRLAQRLRTFEFC